MKDSKQIFETRTRGAKFARFIDQELKKAEIHEDQITYHLNEGGFSIPTFHCFTCKTDTAGFSICLNCNPQTYEVYGMTKPDVIKAVFDKCKCKGHPFNCYNHPYSCGCNEPQSVGIFDTSDANLGQTKKGYAIPNNSVYAKEIWNTAIEAAAELVQNELGEPDDTFWIVNDIRKLKK